MFTFKFKISPTDTFDTIKILELQFTLWSLNKRAKQLAMATSITSEMNGLETLFAQRLEKIAELENFISLYGEKEKRIDQLRELNNKTYEQKKLLLEAEQAVQKFRSTSKPMYDKLLAEMRHQQLVMLTIMEELDKREAENPKAVAAQIKYEKIATASTAKQSIEMFSPVTGVDDCGQVCVIGNLKIKNMKLKTLNTIYSQSIHHE